MYVRKVKDQTLTFQVSGKLWKQSLIMSDVETKTEWAHLLGKAMAGKLKGERLKPLITDMVAWDIWKEQHPETTVLNMSATSKNYVREIYKSPAIFVFGFVVDGKAQAIQIEDLIKSPLHQFETGSVKLLATYDKAGAVTHLFDRKLDDQVLNFEQVNDLIMKDIQTESRWEMLNGHCISGKLKGKVLNQRVGIMSFTTAWMNFHPDSTDVVF